MIRLTFSLYGMIFICNFLFGVLLKLPTSIDSAILAYRPWKLQLCVALNWSPARALINTHRSLVALVNLRSVNCARPRRAGAYTANDNAWGSGHARLVRICTVGCACVWTLSAYSARKIFCNIQTLFEPNSIWTARKLSAPDIYRVKGGRK